ncbi:hypothetical protein SBOR_6323 [Sclerotinia borealis F-4128]|uniref:2EXR domain-containing protein n=1 Tax=Sclerotinia borealis (strain F-4128) TaxID=1432307 RepID=W9CFH4_SCLBF|nr:hypothetical protein SBOR_6323 [Sclerotinia borealis F-4128]
MDLASFDSFRVEKKAWYDLAHPIGEILPNVEEYKRFLPGAIQTIPNHPRSFATDQQFEPSMIEWQDQNYSNKFDVELKGREDEKYGKTKESKAPERERLCKDGLVYDPATWQIFQIKFYHDLPANPIQIAWPSDYTAIVQILESFPKFPRLPTEVRQMIWNHALNCHPRAVKLKVDRKYGYLGLREGGVDTIKLSCHIRQHGPVAAKLPIPLLYVCKESNFLFLKRYKKMNLIVPVQEFDLDLRLVGLEVDEVANCVIRVDRKGYIDFQHDTLMINCFRPITETLWQWNNTSLDLSSIQSIALKTTHLRLDKGRRRRYHKGEMTVWEALETGCPNLKRLTFVKGSMEKSRWDPNLQVVARLLPINTELLDEVVHDYVITHQDNYLAAKNPDDLKELKAYHRWVLRCLSSGLESRYEDARRMRSRFRQQIERNPKYWQNISFDVAFVSWVVSSFYMGKRMEKVIVVPPKDKQAAMQHSYFWAQRPIVFVDDKPKLQLGAFSHPVSCHPDGSLLNRNA